MSVSSGADDDPLHNHFARSVEAVSVRGRGCAKIDAGVYTIV